MSAIVNYSVSAVIGYLIGNLSPSYLVGKRKGYDVRRTGTKNAGASNTLLLAGKAAFVFVMLIDIFKTTIAWKLCSFLFPNSRIAGEVGGIACLLGHIFPFALNFHGGKGFACLGGIALAMGPQHLLILLLVAVVTVALCKYVAVTAVTMSLIVPFYHLYLTRDIVGSAVLLIAFFVMLYKHRENFERMKKGTEARISYLFNKDKEMERLKQSRDYREIEEELEKVTTKNF